MNGSPARPSPASLVAFVVAWAAAATASARVGFWPGLGGAALVLGALSLVVDRSLWRRLYPVRGGALAWGAGGGLLMTAAARTLYPMVLAWAPWVAGDSARLYTAFAALTPLQAALLLPLVIAGEELVWRGVVHGVLVARLGSGAGVGLGAFLYGAATIPSGSPVLAVTAFACGLGWSLLRATTGGLAAPLVSHLVWAALLLFVRPLGPR